MRIPLLIKTTHTLYRILQYYVVCILHIYAYICNCVLGVGLHCNRQQSPRMCRRTVQCVTILLLSLHLGVTEGFGHNTRTTKHEMFAPIASSASRRRFTIQPRIARRPCRSEATELFYHDDDDDNNENEQRRRMELTNNFLKASRTSFKNFEGATDSLLDKNPFVAIIIFFGIGLFVAYVSGFAILDGYIDSSNPMDNGAVPYWDEDLSTP